MADTVTVEWLYPPNWDGSFEPGGGFKRMVVRLTNVSDGTGESDVVKINRSELRNSRGVVPRKLVVEAIEHSCSGMSVQLEFDRDPNEVIAVLSGDGLKDWGRVGGKADPGDVGSGDIILTTIGQIATSTYDITLHLRLK